MSGITPFKANDDTDPLIKRAIILYTKAQFGYDNREAERFRRSYETLKKNLIITRDYGVIS